jgi:hypothetical protein
VQVVESMVLALTSSPQLGCTIFAAGAVDLQVRLAKAEAKRKLARASRRRNRTRQ